MDWLRLWHDMPNDPKWKTIARYSSQPIALVLALYIHLLVDASRNVTRGHVSVTVEDLSSALDVTEDAVVQILDAMQGRVLDGLELSGWGARQPKREDSGNEETGAKSAAQRKREQRERERAEKEMEEKDDSHDKSRKVTTDKSREDKDKDKEHKQLRVINPVDELFCQAWSIYPKRAGGNSKAAARKAWDARLKSGVSADDMLDGVKRYAAYCKTTKRTGTQYVRQASTFFGPDLHFEDEYLAPEPGTSSGGTFDPLAYVNKNRTNRGAGDVIDV